jgi:hypothetical protein
VKFRRLVPAAAGALAALLLAVPASAVVTSTWTVESYPQFDQGDATSAFITSLGEIRPGWDSKRVALEGDGVWAAARLADGTVLIGSDAGGALYRVTGDGARKVTAIPGAIAVVALAVAGDGTVYAGTMPGDKLWRVDVTGGKATTVATLKGVETIWSLAAGPGGTVYAGTGPDGKLFSIAKGGAVKEVFATDDKRVTAVTATPDGAVWFGTSERALVFRHDPKTGDTRAMADFAGNEISDLRPLKGGVVVAANDLTEPTSAGAKSAATVAGAENPNEPKGQAAKAPETGSKPGADKETPANADTGRKGARKGKGALFFVDQNGRLDQLHALTQTYFTSLAVTASGQVYAGAADKGRVYLVDTDDSVATAFDVDERVVSHVLWDGKALTFATDDGAALYRGGGRAAQARYVSEVYDAKSPSRFGRIVWQASGRVKLETRSGNTAKPGAGWSAWAAPAQPGKLGGGSEGGRIASPPGRYLQFRVALEDDKASLRRVTSYLVPQNQATRIDEITLEPAGKESLPTLKDAAAKPRNPTVKVKWKTDNTDGDDSTYLLEVRRDGEANWRTIVTGKTPLTATSWDWNTETFPDGWYRLRVTSSDAIANSPDRALTASRTTPLFAVDNTRPTIEGLTVAYPKASARASDAISTITEMAFSIDDGPWQLGTTSDGIFDDLTEALQVELPADLKKGSHTLAIRVADAAGNLASVSTTFVTR